MTVLHLKNASWRNNYKSIIGNVNITCKLQRMQLIKHPTSQTKTLKLGAFKVRNVHFLRKATFDVVMGCKSEYSRMCNYSSHSTAGGG